MSNPHRLDHDAILAYCQTHPRWSEMDEAECFRLIADAAKESMQWWFHDQIEIAYEKGYQAARDEVSESPQLPSDSPFSDPIMQEIRGRRDKKARKWVRDAVRSIEWFGKDDA